MNLTNCIKQALDQRPVNQKIMRLQDEMLKLKQADVPVKHYFANGFYAREMTMPEGCTVVGKIHKSEHLCILSKGKVELVSEEKTETLEAPYTYVSKPGAKRALYAHSEVVWTTVHKSDETDLDKLEDQLIAESFTQLEVEKKLCLG